MMPLGVLAGSRHIAAGSGGGWTFHGTQYDDTNNTTRTFTLPIGAPSASRSVIALVQQIDRGGSGRWRSAITIGGSSPTDDYRYNSGSVEGHATWYRATVASGTTVALKSTGANPNVTLVVSVWTYPGAVAASGGASVRLFQPATITVAPSTTASGLVMACLGARGAWSDAAWTAGPSELTKRSSSVSSLVGEAAGTGSSVTVTASATSPVAQVTLVAVCYTPA